MIHDAEYMGKLSINASIASIFAFGAVEESFSTKGGIEYSANNEFEAIHFLIKINQNIASVLKRYFKAIFKSLAVIPLSSPLGALKVIGK